MQGAMGSQNKNIQFGLKGSRNILQPSWTLRDKQNYVNRRKKKGLTRRQEEHQQRYDDRKE